MSRNRTDGSVCLIGEYLQPNVKTWRRSHRQPVHQISSVAHHSKALDVWNTGAFLQSSDGHEDPGPGIAAQQRALNCRADKQVIVPPDRRAEQGAIYKEAYAALKAGKSPADAVAMDIAERHRRSIDRCSHERRLVDQNIASWNQIASWLRDVDALLKAA